MFICILDALAVIRFGRSLATNDGSGLTDLLLINSLDNDEYEKLYEYFDEELQKYSKGARKYKGKTVKPEKVKKKKSFMADTLQKQQ